MDFLIGPVELGTLSYPVLGPDSAALGWASQRGLGEPASLVNVPNLFFSFPIRYVTLPLKTWVGLGEGEERQGRLRR